MENKDDKETNLETDEENSKEDTSLYNRQVTYNEAYLIEIALKYLEIHEENMRGRESTAGRNKETIWSAIVLSAAKDVKDEREREPYNWIQDNQ